MRVSPLRQRSELEQTAVASLPVRDGRFWQSIARPKEVTRIRLETRRQVPQFVGYVRRDGAVDRLARFCLIEENAIAPAISFSQPRSFQRHRIANAQTRPPHQ